MTLNTTLIMHQHKRIIRFCTFRYIVGVVVLYLKIVDGDGGFEKLVLNLLNDNILAVARYKNITRSELDRFNPALLRRVERMRWCRNGWKCDVEQPLKSTAYHPVCGNARDR